MKKFYKEHYKKSKKINYLQLPKRVYITLDGSGGPEGDEFKAAIPLLYKMAYSLRMSYKKDLFAEYEQFTVGPLEGIWTTCDNNQYQAGDDKSRLDFKLMIAQPKWFTKAMFDQLQQEIIPDLPEIINVQYEEITEGKCVQILHIGEFATEAETLKDVFKDLQEKGLEYIPESHHEIYLSDFRRVSPERLQTLIRYQIK